jgi:hypothetical protein
MSTFKTTNGVKYVIDIKTKDAKAVKELLKYPADGKPVDILEAVETGTLAGIYNDIGLLVDVVFVLCLDQIKENFDIAKYDLDNAKSYALQPELAAESPLTKASRWFGGTVDGDSVIEMITAFTEAVINFTPSETRREAMRAILAREKEIAKLESEYRIKSVEKMYEKTKQQLAKRWETLATQQQEKLLKELDGHIDSFMNSQEF